MREVEIEEGAQAGPWEGDAETGGRWGHETEGRGAASTVFMGIEIPKHYGGRSVQEPWGASKEGWSWWGS